MMSDNLLDVGESLKGLKDFQCRTVEYVFDRMYCDSNPARRFLVADEVGLGKTLVARGIVAKVVEQLQKKDKKRIDVLYICSNATIAQQNLNRLNVTDQRTSSFATRLTLLPLQLQSLTGCGKMATNAADESFYEGMGWFYGSGVPISVFCRV
jgi:hypothetical protein